jgi:hypothetical protein
MSADGSAGVVRLPAAARLGEGRSGRAVQVDGSLGRAWWSAPCSGEVGEREERRWRAWWSAPYSGEVGKREERRWQPGGRIPPRMGARPEQSTGVPLLGRVLQLHVEDCSFMYKAEDVKVQHVRNIPIAIFLIFLMRWIVTS